MCMVPQPSQEELQQKKNTVVILTHQQNALLVYGREVENSVKGTGVLV